MTLVWKEKTYQIEINWSVLIIFEKIAGHELDLLSISDIILLFYSALTLAMYKNHEDQPDYDEFFSFVGKNQPILLQFINFVETSLKDKE